jgi:glycine cleavage system transcriptional repressor
VSAEVAVTVVGVDRPGIVAAVTKVLFELGCNLKDATSTILSGNFAMMLAVEMPAELDAAALESSLGDVARALDLVVTVRPLHAAHTEIPTPTHMVSVYGADRPGIVYRVAEHLAARDINITDLSSRLLEGETPTYAVMLEVVAGADVDVAESLSRLEEELGVAVTVKAIEADIL